jgi:hypothetical protein
MDKQTFDYPEQIAQITTCMNGHVKVAAKELNKKFTITIQERKPPKTWQQCKGWHRILGVIVDLLNEHNVDNKFWKLEHVKYYVKRAIEYGEYRLDTFIPKSFADATKQEAIDIIKKTQEFAVDELKMEREAVRLTSYEEQAFKEYYDKHA